MSMSLETAMAFDKGYVEGRRDAMVAATAARVLSEGDEWPCAVSDGLTLACADCGQVPLFDYRVADDFWRAWVPDKARTGVVCLPCLDRRCGGAGLAAAVREVQWTGTGHTVVLRPTAAYEYGSQDR